MNLRSIRATPLAAFLLLAAAPLHATGPGAPLNPSAITYQAQVKLNGTPVNGTYDLQFRLFDAPTNGNQIGTTELVNDAVLANGLLSTILDFAPTLPFDGFERYLEIGIRAGADNGPYTLLTPRQPLTPAPYASLALEAETAYSAALNSVTSNSIVDGSIISADIADGAIGAADVNSAQIQRRIGLPCDVGTAISAVAADGTATCVAVGGGGGGIADGSVTTPKLADNAVTAIKLAFGSVDASKLVAGSVTSAAIADGSVAAVDLAGGSVGSNAIQDGSITAADLGAGSVGSLALIDGSVAAADVDPNGVQRRVSGVCAAGNAIRTINNDGTVVCQAASGGSSGWGLTGNSGTDPATNFIGTTDAKDFGIRVNNLQVARFGVASNTGNIVLGNVASNTIGDGAYDVFMAGGGTIGPDSNAVYDNHGVVAGGFMNIAGKSDGNATAQAAATVGGGHGNIARNAYATVAGGDTNTANGNSSTISGGFFNTAGGLGAVVPGGNQNTAGGDFSFAAGRGAVVRTQAVVGEQDSCSGTSSCGDEGTFIWSDSLPANPPLQSTGPHQFMARAAGGFMFNATQLESTSFDDVVMGARAAGTGGDADMDLVLRSRSGKIGRVFVADSTGNMVFTAQGDAAFNAASFGFGTAPAAGRYFNTLPGAYLSSGGTWTNSSSRALKDVLAAVDAGSVLEAVLALPLTSWHYKAEPASLHIGPMAEDFRAAFGLGADAEHIATVDADGVALAAIQGLNRKLEAENRALRERLERIERRLGTADPRASGE